MMKFKTLNEFLNSNQLTVDGILDDGWGENFLVKGIEIEATILFADISSFSTRTMDLTPPETLIYLNRFFTWISAEGLKNSYGIVDKYIGDEIMVVFSNEFGSQDHFVEAVQTARMFAERDEWGYQPHMGIASGNVIVGYIGTPENYSCSVFGRAVTVASRCASTKISVENSASISITTELWKQYSFDNIFHPIVYPGPKGGDDTRKMPIDWYELESVKTRIKNDEFEVTSIVKEEIIQLIFEVEKNGNLGNTTTAIDRAKEDLLIIKNQGLYHPITNND